MRSWQWPAWGTTATIIVADDAALGSARRLVAQALGQVEQCADLFNPGSEVSKLAGAAGHPRKISPLLAALIEVSLTHARETDGLCDPTVGAAVIHAKQAGSPPHKAVSLLSSSGVPGIPAPRRPAPAVPGWRSIELTDRTLRMPAGTILDLTALGRASTARYCADLVWNRLGVGVLVDLGGDSATAGMSPPPGWPMFRSPRASGDEQPLDTWQGSVSLTRPVINPGTGLPTPQVWRSIEISPDSLRRGLVEAKSLAIAAGVLGVRAPEWLARENVYARLEARDGTVTRIGDEAESFIREEPWVSAS